MTKKSKSSRSTDLLLKLFLAAILVLAILKLSFDRSDPPIIADQSANSSRSSLANCLNRQGAVMYGVDTCEFCQNQKKMFGEDFNKINYVNCDFEKELCRGKGINYFPVWEIAGQSYPGLQTFDTLAQRSGCPQTK